MKRDEVKSKHLGDLKQALIVCDKRKNGRVLERELLSYLLEKKLVFPKNFLMSVLEIVKVG